MKNIGPSFLKVEEKNFEWCHVCGQRYSGNWAELWISKNAEHGHEATPRSNYVRFCGDCARQIAKSVRAGEFVEITRQSTTPPKSAFITWLEAQKPRKDPVGDLAGDFCESSCCRHAQTPMGLRRHMTAEHSACQGALDALERAQKEWQQTL